MQNKTKPESTQDSFNRVWQHFVVEKNPQCLALNITNPALSVCRYRHEGNGCAIGCQLPDELIKDKEGVGIAALTGKDYKDFDPAIADWFSNVDRFFLIEIQVAHDTCGGHVERPFSAVARRFNLTIPTQPTN